MKALYCTVLYYLARDGSSKVVNTETNVGRVDESSGGGCDSMGVSSIGGSIGVSSISSVEESRVSLSLSFTLAIVVARRWLRQHGGKLHRRQHRGIQHIQHRGEQGQPQPQLHACHSSVRRQHKGRQHNQKEHSPEWRHQVPG